MSSSSGSSSGGRRPHDITSKQGLTGLYNSGVASVEHVTRPLGGSGGSLGIEHSGVVVTTNSGDRWLVHKGKGYGDSGQTVVTNAKHMSGAWTSGGSQSVQPGTKVADYVKASGQNYNLLSDNCHDGSKRMMDVGKGKR
ncbi:uncharacterized protein LOC144666977 isoform X2 [Oculina patagonica]